MPIPLLFHHIPSSFTSLNFSPTLARKKRKMELFSQIEAKAADLQRTKDSSRQERTKNMYFLRVRIKFVSNILQRSLKRSHNLRKKILYSGCTKASKLLRNVHIQDWHVCFEVFFFKCILCYQNISNSETTMKN